MDKYDVGSIIGEGQFGSVREAILKPMNVFRALKFIHIPRFDEGVPHPVAREFLISTRMKHAHIVNVFEVFPHGSSVVIAMERCASNLASLLAAHYYYNPLPLSVGKRYFCMLLMALHHIHQHRVVHRDVTPANCFLTADGVLKLGDFGLSRMQDDQDMSHEVGSRWYRAPELLFGQRRYKEEVDMWSAGCVLAELLRGFSGAFFSGNGDIDQLSKIFDILGTPSAETWPGAAELPDWEKVRFEERAGYGLAGLLPRASEKAIDLLKRLLSLNPQMRPSARDVLQHPFFYDEE